MTVEHVLGCVLAALHAEIHVSILGGQYREAVEDGVPAGLALSRRIHQGILRLRVVPFGTVLGLRTTTLQNGESVPRRARI